MAQAFLGMDLPHLIMIVVFSCTYLPGYRPKKFEPLLLLPIAFGMLLSNLPITGLMSDPSYGADGKLVPGGLLYYLYQGVKLGIYPSLIFPGHRRDDGFRPAESPGPPALLLGAAAQMGIYCRLHGGLSLWGSQRRRRPPLASSAALTGRQPSS